MVPVWSASTCAAGVSNATVSRGAAVVGAIGTIIDGTAPVSPTAHRPIRSCPTRTQNVTATWVWPVSHRDR
jgi:hypothetical protein